MASVNLVGIGSYTSPAERREHNRVKAGVQIELRREGDPAAIRTKTSDISLGGCYVEMMFTLEKGTNLQVALWANGERLCCKGIVATRHPQVGNGIQFLEMSAGDRRLLENVLESLPQ
jgi:c-di-GMP-binding flagellar brake protein YcgR